MLHIRKIKKSHGTIYKNIPLINVFDYFVTKKCKIVFLNGKYMETIAK